MSAAACAGTILNAAAGVDAARRGRYALRMNERARFYLDVRATVALLPLCLCVACGPKRPVFYPNETLGSIPPETQQRDIDDCLAKAEEAVRTGVDWKGVAVDTGKGAVVGAAAGAVGGAIWGSAGSGAGAGAAGGAVAGLLSHLLFRERPDPLVRGYTERCLREKGYDPVGWD